MEKRKRYQEQREKFAQALAVGHTPEQAGKIAGYKGAANARRNAQRADVKARVAELRAPAVAKVQQQIDVNVEWAVQKLAFILNHAINPGEIKPTDQIASARVLAQILGWLAPEKVEHSLNGLGDRLDRALARAKRKG